MAESVPRTTPYTFGHQPNKPDSNGNNLVALAKLTSTCLPQTCASTHKGDPWTWQARRGDKHRIDYIGIPYHWKNANTATWVDPDADISSGSVDHLLLVCALEVTLSTQTKSIRYRAVHHDRCLLGVPARAHIARQALEAAPVLPWRAHANDGLTIWTWFARHVLEIVCPIRRHRRRKRWIAQDTLDLIAIRSAARRQLESVRANDPSGEHADEKAELKLARRAVTYAVRQDKRARDTAIAECLVQADQQGNTREIFKLAKTLTPFKRKGGSMVALESGEPAPSHQAPSAQPRQL